jgi:glycosyltransferase involved in cell wall biosynthesis
MDIGIMPLVDDEFQRGKCGLKLLQYMAAGLPTIGSPVGVNAEIIDEPLTGFLPRTDEQWRQALTALILDGTRRRQMGKAGRERCVAHYSLDGWLPSLDHLLRSVANPDENKLSRTEEFEFGGRDSS